MPQGSVFDKGPGIPKIEVCLFHYTTRGCIFSLKWVKKHQLTQLKKKKKKKKKKQ